MLVKLEASELNPLHGVRIQKPGFAQIKVLLF